MLTRVVHRTVASLIPLFVLACAAGDEDQGSTFGSFTTQPSTTFGDDAEDETSDSNGDGDGDPTTTTTGDGDGDDPTTTTTGDGDGDPTTTTGDGDPTTTGDGDGDPPASCGNGVIDPGETCDGANFNGVTCFDLGYDGGALSCNNCAVSVASCTNAPQPGLGQLYSHCLDANSCPGLDGCATVSMEGEMQPFDGYCTNLCTTDAECFANTGGTAVPQCNDEAQSYCELDCSGGKTCPGGMVCTSLVGGKELCY